MTSLFSLGDFSTPVMLLLCECNCQNDKKLHQIGKNLLLYGRGLNLHRHTYIHTCIQKEEPGFLIGQAGKPKTMAEAEIITQTNSYKAQYSIKSLYTIKISWCNLTCMDKHEI